MSTARRIISVVLLCGWIFATGHVACAHGGAADCGAHVAPFGTGGHDCDCGVGHGGDEHHHHDLTALAKGQSASSSGHKALEPVGVPLSGALADQLMAMLREAREPREVPDGEHSPPDERAFGWLLVIATAHPVRGPSVA